MFYENSSTITVYHHVLDYRLHKGGKRVFWLLGLFLIFSVLDGGLGLPQLQLYHKLANENCQNFQKQTCGSWSTWQTSNSEDASLTSLRAPWGWPSASVSCLRHLLARVPVLDVEGRQHALEVALVSQPGVVMTLKPDPLVVIVRLGAVDTTDRASGGQRPLKSQHRFLMVTVLKTKWHRIDGYLREWSAVHCSYLW